MVHQLHDDDVQYWERQCGVFLVDSTHRITLCLVASTKFSCWFRQCPGASKGLRSTQLGRLNSLPDARNTVAKSDNSLSAGSARAAIQWVEGSAKGRGGLSDRRDRLGSLPDRSASRHVSGARIAAFLATVNRRVVGTHAVRRRENALLEGFACSRPGRFIVATFYDYHNLCGEVPAINMEAINSEAARYIAPNDCGALGRFGYVNRYFRSTQMADHPRPDVNSSKSKCSCGLMQLWTHVERRSFC